MTYPTYHNLFPDWAAVQTEFRPEGLSSWDDDHKADIAAALPEPEEVILADYNYEDYSGDAVVVYRIGTTIYINEGGHCSCYGLEGQWGPVDYDSIDLAIECIEKGWDYGLKAVHKAAVLANLRARNSKGKPLGSIAKKRRAAKVKPNVASDVVGWA